MNGSSVANTSPSIKSKEDQGLSGHDEKENPFAEYMWMENEEDFNRQVKKWKANDRCNPPALTFYHLSATREMGLLTLSVCLFAF